MPGQGLSEMIRGAFIVNELIEFVYDILAQRIIAGLSLLKPQLSSINCERAERIQARNRLIIEVGEEIPQDL